MVSMPRNDHTASDGATRCIQRPGALVHLAGGAQLSGIRYHRENWFGVLERRGLTFSIYAQHERVFGRVQVQPDDVEHFLDKETIIGQFEAARAVQLQSARMARPSQREFVVQPLDAALAKPRAPERHPRAAHPKVRGDHAVGFTLGHAPNHLHPPHQRRREALRAIDSSCAVAHKQFLVWSAHRYLRHEDIA